MLKRENEPIRERNRDVVLFLRIEPAETTDEKDGATYSVQLDVKSGVEFPGKEKINLEPVVTTISPTLTNTLPEFTHLRARFPQHIKLFGAAESLDLLTKMEKTIGVEIYRTFLPDAVGEAFEYFLNLLYRRKVTRLTLVISSSIPGILDIPFEMMRKDEETGPILLSYNAFHLVHSIESTLDDFQLTSLEPPAPPLRILFVAALPVDLPPEQRLLELEHEQERLIESLGELITDKKIMVEFLDITTMDEIEQALQAGDHHVVHFSGHGVHLDLSGQKSGVLYLEDEFGNTVKVTGKELSERLRAYSSIRLVILNACETAHSDDYGVAGALIYGGVPTVLGMRYTVSDEKAILFTSRFYTTVCQGKPLAHAMFNARKAIYDLEKEKAAALLQKIKADKPPYFLEWITPFLYQNQEILHLIDYSKESADTRYFFQKPFSLVLGGKYVGRGFVGRRKEILELNRLFNEGKRSVCIYGQGGLGKTTLAVRFADNFENGAYKIIQFRGEISEEIILTRLSKEASRYLGNEIIEYIQSPKNDAMDKLDMLTEHFLSRHKRIILFDNFEENQRKLKGKKEYRREIHSPRLNDFLTHLCKNLKRFSYILFTTRYLFPEPRTASLNLGEMTFPDTYKLITRYENLVSLPTAQKRLIHENLGGHPHALGLLEECTGLKDMSWERILQKFREIKDKELNQELLLDMLWNQLTGDEQTALKGASVFRELTSAEGLMAVTGMSEAVVSRAVKSLNTLSLIYLEEEEFHVHRVTADFVQNTKMDRKQLLDYHRKAAEYFEGIRYEEEKRYIGNDIEARWHFLEAEEWDRAAEITFEVDIFLKHHGYPRVSFEFLKEIEEKELNAKNRLLVHHQLGMQHLDYGEYKEAMEQYGKSLKISGKTRDLDGICDTLGEIGLIWKNLGDNEKAFTYYKKSLEIAVKINDKKAGSTSLHNIGTIYFLEGRFDEALEHYQKSLAISEKIGEKVGAADSYHQMGMVCQHKGDYRTALTFYQKAVKISEEIGDVKGTASSLHQEGNIYCIMMDYDTALDYYQKSLEIKEEIDDIKGISDTLHQIGMIRQRRGDYDTSSMYYRKALELSEKIGDMHGVASSTQQLGKIHQYKGDFDTALDHYRKTIEICEKIGNIEGAAHAFGQMGILYNEVKEFPAALECSLRAFLVFSQIQSPKAFGMYQNILMARANLSDTEYKEILKKYDIPPDAFDNPR